MSREPDDSAGDLARREPLERGLHWAFGQTPSPSRSNQSEAPGDGCDRDFEELVTRLGVDDLPRYDMLQELGRGGMGIVLRAMDSELGREVAIKVLRDDVDAQGVIDRFRAEARITGQLEHPSIVPVYDCGLTTDGRAWMSMRLVEGETLRSALDAREDPLADRLRFLGIFERIVQAVAFAHVRGVVHRDLKPANVMLGAFGEVQVMDWGLAKVLGEHDGAVSHQVVGSPRAGSLAGSVFGTYAYMAPEQAAGHVDRVDRRADVFALGAMLVHVLVGEAPYSSYPEDEFLPAVLEARLDRAFALLENVPPPLRDIARACLEQEPANRPSDAGALAELVSSYLRDEQQRARRAEVEAAEARAAVRHERRLRQVTLLAAALITVAVLAAVGTWWSGERDRQERVRRVDADVATIETELRQHTRLAEAAQGDAALTLWQQTEATAARGVALAASVDEAVAVRARIGTLHREVIASRAAARATHALAEQRRSLRQRAFEVFEAQSSAVSNQEREDAYLTAAPEFGVDLAATDLAERIEASPVRAETVEFLAGWALWTEDPDRREQLDALLDRVDRDPWRAELHKAWQSPAPDALLALCQQAEFLRDASTTTLCKAVVHLRTRLAAADALPLVRRMWAVRPGDWMLNAGMQRLLRASELASSQAHIEFDRVQLALRPDSLVWSPDLASRLVQQGRAAEGLEVIDGALIRHGEVARLLSARSTCLLALGRDDEAEAALQRAAELEPESVRVLTALAGRAMKRREWQVALGHLRQALRSDESRDDTFVLIAAVQVAQQQHEAAYQTLLEALEAGLENDHLLEMIRLVGQASGRIGRSVQAGRRLVENLPHHFKHHFELARVALLATDLETAEQALDQAAKLAESDRDRRQVQNWQDQLDATLALRERVTKQYPGDAVPATLAASVELVGELHAGGLDRIAMQITSRALKVYESPDLDRCRLAANGAAAAARLANRWWRQLPERALDDRQQSMRWLHLALDELQGLEQTTGQERRILAETAEHCLQDKAFASVRDEPDASLLPPSERQAWRDLWREVRTFATR